MASAVLSSPALLLDTCCCHGPSVSVRACLCIDVCYIFHVREYTSALCFVCMFVASALMELWRLCLNQPRLCFVKCSFSRLVNVLYVCGTHFYVYMYCLSVAKTSS